MISAKKTRLAIPFSLVLTLCASVLTVLFAGILSIQLYNVSSTYLKSHHDDMYEAQFSQTVGALSQQVASLETAGELICQDAELLECLEKYMPRDIQSDSDLRTALDALCYKARIVVPSIRTIVLLGEDIWMTSGENAFGMFSYGDFLDAYGEIPDTAQLHIPYQNTEQAIGSVQKLDASTFLYCPVRLQDGTGICVCVVVNDDFWKESLPANMSAAIITDSDAVVYNTTGMSPAQLKVSAGNAQFLKTATFAPGIRFVAQADTKAYEIEINSLRILLVVLLCLTAVVAFAFSLVIARPLTQPLLECRKRLVNQNGKAQKITGKRIRTSAWGSLFLYFVIIALVFSLLITIIFAVYFVQFIEKAYVSSLENSLEQVKVEVESFLDNVHYASFYLAYSSEIQDYLETGQLHQNLPSVTNVEDILESGKKWFATPIALCLLDRDGYVIAATDSLLFDVNTHLQVDEIDGKQWNCEQYRDSHWITNLTSIRSANTYRPLGYMILKVDELYLEKAYTSFKTGIYKAYLHTPDEIVLSSNDQQAIGLMIPDAGNSIVFEKKLNNIDLTLTFLVDSDNLDAYKQETTRACVYLLIIVSLAVVLISLGVSRGFVKGLRSMEKTLSGTSGLLPRQVENRSFVREFDDLYLAFNQMSRRIEELMEETAAAEARQYQLEISKQHADMLLLQSQINPHFLYNTFEIISHLIHTGAKEDAIRMLNYLTDMLRFAAKNDQNFIPLRDELRYVESYMKIMRVRYPDMLFITYDIAPEVEMAKTVKFILQPILENAIVHGFAPRGGNGYIRIHAAAVGGRLVITIRDDGVGMNADTLEKLRRSLVSQEEQDSIGLPNIARRIRLNYGDEYGVNIVSGPDAGTIVTIALPLELS